MMTLRRICQKLARNGVGIDGGGVVIYYIFGPLSLQMTW